MKQEISYQQFQMFMVNCFAHQLHEWMSSSEATPPHLDKRFAGKFNELRSAVRTYTKLYRNQAEDDLFEVGDEFQAIMGYIQKYAKKDTVGAWSILQVCTIYASGDIADLEKLWRDLGIFISQSKVQNAR